MSSLAEMAEISPLLLHTVHHVLDGLLAAGEIEIETGREGDVIRFCGRQLADAGMGAQLIDTLSKALIRCEDVVELYADNDRIKELITGVGEP